MSKKKRPLQSMSVIPNSAESSEPITISQSNRIVEAEAQMTSEPSGNTRSGSRLRYLKTHWWAVALVAFLALSGLGAGLKYLEEDARRQAANGNSPLNPSENQSLLNRINPFVTLPSPTPTPQLSKEYIYAGSRLLAVEDANATAIPPTDLAVWRPATGYWYVMGDGGTIRAAEQWGAGLDNPKPGDYDGDGKTDFCVFRKDDPSAGSATWYIRRSSDGTFEAVVFGASTDLPAPADFDGDGKTDPAVFRKNTPSGSGRGTWYVRKSSDQQLMTIELDENWDTNEKSLAPADYDGDGRADATLWRSASASFLTKRSSDNNLQTISFTGQSASDIVSGDYDGDGKADYAIRNGANWVIRNSSTGTMQPAIAWQLGTDQGVPNDYDGDGKVDIAVWRNTNGDWYIRNSTTGQLRQVHWGADGDKPVPVFYRR